MFRFSSTLYLCESVADVIAALEREGWRRTKIRLPHESARLANGRDAVIVYENHEVVAKGEAAMATLERLWRNDGALGFSPIGENSSAAAQTSAPQAEAGGD